MAPKLTKTKGRLRFAKSAAGSAPKLNRKSVKSAARSAPKAKKKTVKSAAGSGLKNEPGRPRRLAVRNITSDHWCVVMSAMNRKAAAKAEEDLTDAWHKKISKISKGQCGMEVRFHSGLIYQRAWDLVDGLVGSQNRGWRIRPLGASGDSFRKRPAVAVAAGARHG